MNLVVDIGNTRIKSALFDGDQLMDIVYYDAKEAHKILDGFDGEIPSRAILSSVSDTHSIVQKILMDGGIQTLIFTQDTPVPIQVDYQQKTTLGLDRMADAVAIYTLSKKKYKLIIDAGTCITYNYVMEDTFIGGAISPGLKIRYQSLHTFTDRLPLIKELRPIGLVGTNTKESIQSGVVNGITLEIQGVCDHFIRQNDDTEIFLTGGDGIFFAEGLKNTIFADPFLTLRGLNKILIFNED